MAVSVLVYKASLGLTDVCTLAPSYPPRFLSFSWCQRFSRDQGASVSFVFNVSPQCPVRCYYVPLLRPLIHYVPWSWCPFVNLWFGHYVPCMLCPLSGMSLGVYNFCTLHPWSLHPLITMALEHSIPVVTISLICLAICTFILNFFFRTPPTHGLFGRLA